MKKVNLLMLGLLGIFTFGITNVYAEEELTIEPYSEFENENALSNDESNPIEEFSQNERAAVAPTVSYRTHVQKIGWQGWKSNGQAAGTSGQAKRLEAIELKVQNSPYSGEIQYSTHIQKIGWQGFKKNGQVSGTSGQAKRLEAIKIQLTGELGQRYDVFYRVHAQKFGWMGWEKGGLSSGTAAYAYRLEAIEVKLVPKKSYVYVDYSSQVSFREKRTYAGELNAVKLGVPDRLLKNGLKLFKDENSVNKFALAEVNDPNRKTIYARTYKITQGLKTIGYSAEFFGPY
ncbi:hypothetical protein [Enterococcus sp. AZ126]|uniref:hypothetical protein n=1 Tax=Enterococcus sp. AZ126 TaxID=2774635 RepID=UPI003F24EB77